MKSSYIARKIDEEYRKKKEYELKKRVKCKKTECFKCAYNKICEDREDLEE